MEQHCMLGNVQSNIILLPPQAEDLPELDASPLPGKQGIDACSHGIRGSATLQPAMVDEQVEQPVNVLAANADTLSSMLYPAACRATDSHSVQLVQHLNQKHAAMDARFHMKPGPPPWPPDPSSHNATPRAGSERRMAHAVYLTIQDHQVSNTSTPAQADWPCKPLAQSLKATGSSCQGSFGMSPLPSGQYADLGPILMSSTASGSNAHYSTPFRNTLPSSGSSRIITNSNHAARQADITAEDLETSLLDLMPIPPAHPKPSAMTLPYMKNVDDSLKLTSSLSSSSKLGRHNLSSKQSTSSNKRTVLFPDSQTNAGDLIPAVHDINVSAAQPADRLSQHDNSLSLLDGETRRRLARATTDLTAAQKRQGFASTMPGAPRHSQTTAEHPIPSYSSTGASERPTMHSRRSLRASLSQLGQSLFRRSSTNVAAYEQGHPSAGAHVPDYTTVTAATSTAGHGRGFRSLLRMTSNGLRASTVFSMLNNFVSNNRSSNVGEEGEIFFTSLDDFKPITLQYRCNRNVRMYFACAQATGQHFILRKYNKACLLISEERRIRASLGLSQQLRHPNLLPVRGHWETEDAVFVVEEFASNGDLLQDSLAHPERYTENFMATRVIKPLLTVLAYLHSQRIAHRAVYPENVYLARDGGLRLGKYSQMVDLNHDQIKDKGLFLDYMPPEAVAMMDQDEQALRPSEAGRRRRVQQARRDQVTSQEEEQPVTTADMGTAGLTSSFSVSQEVPQAPRQVDMDQLSAQQHAVADQACVQPDNDDLETELLLLPRLVSELQPTSRLAPSQPSLPLPPDSPDTEQYKKSATSIVPKKKRRAPKACVSEPQLNLPQEARAAENAVLRAKRDRQAASATQVVLPEDQTAPAEAIGLPQKSESSALPPQSSVRKALGNLGKFLQSFHRAATSSSLGSPRAGQLSVLLSGGSVISDRKSGKSGQLDIVVPHNPWEWKESYDEKADIWQVGCLMHELSTGCLPFEVEDRVLCAALIMWADIQAFPDHLSPQCVSFMQACFTKDPRSRPTAEQLLQHEWIVCHSTNQDLPSMAALEAMANKLPDESVTLTARLFSFAHSALQSASKAIGILPNKVEPQTAAVLPRDISTVKKEAYTCYAVPAAQGWRV